MSRKLIPNSTQIPDVILDEWMPRFEGAELKVILFVARKTFGWGKEEDRLSIAQMRAGTGLSRRGVIDACNYLEACGVLICTPSELPNGHPQALNTYRLNTEWEGELVDHKTWRKRQETPSTSATIAPVQPLHPCNEPHRTSAIIAPEPVQSLHPQETRIQETKEQETKTGAAAPPAPKPPPVERTQKTRIPVPFTLHTLPENRDWATEQVPGLDIEAATAEFIDYAVSTGARYALWQPAWRNSMRRAFRQRPRHSSALSPRLQRQQEPSAFGHLMPERDDEPPPSVPARRQIGAAP